MHDIFYLLGILGLILSAGVLFGQAPPYPPSDLIETISWDYDSHIKHGQGSDQWPLTWGSDDQLYAAWGDGWGWDSLGIKRSMGVTRILGNLPHLNGHDLWGTGPGSGYAKPEALIAINDTLWLFWTVGDSKYDDHSSLAYSYDFGETWLLDSSQFFPEFEDGFRVRGICQYGPGYQDATDDYVYVYFGFNRQENLYLARVSVSNFEEASAYAWFIGMNDGGEAQWGDFADRAPAFHDENAYLWHIGVSYHPGLQRYLLTKPHYAPDDNRETIFAPETHMGSLGVFEAPNPWGPWKTVFYQDNFVDEYVKFSYFIPPKFMNQTDHSFWLLWSGWPEYDQASFMKGTFIVSE